MLDLCVRGRSKICVFYLCRHSNVMPVFLGCVHTECVECLSIRASNKNHSTLDVEKNSNTSGVNKALDTLENKMTH